MWLAIVKSSTNLTYFKYFFMWCTKSGYAQHFVHQAKEISCCCLFKIASVQLLCEKCSQEPQSLITTTTTTTAAAAATVELVYLSFHGHIASSYRQRFSRVLRYNFCRICLAFSVYSVRWLCACARCKCAGVVVIVAFAIFCHSFATSSVFFLRFDLELCYWTFNLKAHVVFVLSCLGLAWLDLSFIFFMHNFSLRCAAYQCVLMCTHGCRFLHRMVVDYLNIFFSFFRHSVSISSFKICLVFVFWVGVVCAQITYIAKQVLSPN